MTSGIHHISAIASDAQKTIDFYSGVLGLRLVKQTVNQDDPGIYHLFFGDKEGFPGMDLTFFIFLPSQQGTIGSGMVSKISFAVPIGSLEFWKKRLLNIMYITNRKLTDFPEID
jgi:glyoxalase family protein